MKRKLGVGIVGCGNISASYLDLAPLFGSIDIRACADIDRQAAGSRAAAYQIRPETVEGLLESPDIELVVNLTVPAAHYEISARALDAGKHVYSEKPFVLSVAEGMDLASRAAAGSLRIGSAPDTFLGGAHQLARHLLDTGAIGRIIGGTCHVMSRGMEHWHPDPAFFFKPGGGPVLDLGPYYLSNLVQLIGPVARVAALTSIPSPRRRITSAQRFGAMIDVETPTTVHALMEFASGAIVTLGASWDVLAHAHRPMELYGTEGSLYLPDPNFFGGEVTIDKGDGNQAILPDWDHPLGVPNQKHGDGMMANYRTAGLADMADAIIKDRPHRCSFEFALHVVDIMTSMLRSGETGEFVDLSTACKRPAALGINEAGKLLRD